MGILESDGFSVKIGRRAKAGVWDPGFGRGRGGRNSRSAKTNADPRNYDVNAAMQLAPVRGAVGFLARTAAASAIEVQERSGGQWRAWQGNTAELPLWATPDLRPNRRQDRYDFRYMLTSNILAGGNGYGVVSTRRDGFPDSLIAPPGSMVAPYGQSVFETPKEVGTFSYSVNGEQMQPYSSLETDGDVLHIKLETRTDMLFGTSPLMEGAPTLRAALAAESHAEMFFNQGGIPPALLMALGEADTESRDALTQYYDRQRDNPDERHRPLVLDGEWKWLETFINPELMQLLDTRKFTWSVVSSNYGLPPPLIGHPDVTTWGAGVRQLVRFAQVGAVSPLLLHLSWALSELLPTDMRVVLTPHHLNEAEPLEKARYYERAVKTGWLLPSEVREMENLPPIPGLDERLSPSSTDDGGDSDSGKDDGSTDNIEDAV